uniref:Uncharacterized protein n=1 Tax=Rhizophora mucronata TaxID=61149 RepID=A0A2P2NXC8_RHIMU
MFFFPYIFICRNFGSFGIIGRHCDSLLDRS